MASSASEGPKKPARKRPPKPKTEPLRRGKACLNCRHLKIRCDGAVSSLDYGQCTEAHRGQRPVCGPCIRVPKDDECEYTDGNSRTRELQAMISRLKARVSELEGPSGAPSRLLLQPEAGPSSFGLPPSPSIASSGLSDGSGLLSSGSDNALLGIQEPPPDMLPMLLDSFLPHAVQYGFFMHTGRFRVSALLQLPLGHPAQPSPALLCAAYLWGIHLSRSEPMVSYEAVFIRRAQQHIATELSDTMHSAHRIHTVQAHVLLSTYFLRTKHFLEAEFHMNGAVTLALGYQLHRIRSSRPPTPPMLGTSAASLDALPDPPRDSVEEGERIRGFWTIVCHQNNLLMSVRSPNNNFGVLESPGLSIDTPWPLELNEYELGMLPADLRGSDTVQSLVAHGVAGPSSPFSLHVQASVLLQRAMQLAMPPQTAAAHASGSAWLETRVQQLTAQLPPIAAYYNRSEEARILALTQSLLNAALIQLHKNDADTTGNANIAVAAARNIITTFGDANVPDFLCASPAVGTLLLLACQVVLREIERTRYFRANAGASTSSGGSMGLGLGLYDQEEVALLVDLQNGLTTMTLYSMDSPLGPSLALFSLLNASVSVAWPGQNAYEARAPANPGQVLDGQTGTRIALPPRPTETGTKQIPDAAHPFQAPGPKDQRGPCPGMNTLANHGYIPRNGIATFEDIVNGMLEAFNTQIDFGAFLVAANMLMRGNPFTNKLSIGGLSPLVKPLPKNLGSPQGPGGLALHGGFEGDASMTRADVAIGDNRNFQNLLYDMDLLQLGKFGGDGPDGNSTVFNPATMAAIKHMNLISNHANDPKFSISLIRFNAMFTEASFLLDTFANGTTEQATLPIIGSFLRNQTFPANWFRAARPKTGGEHAGDIIDALLATAPEAFFLPGRNDENGVYVPDAPVPAPFNASFSCGMYYDLFSTMPGGMANTTGLFLDNVKLLSGMIRKILATGQACDVDLLPFGPPVN
ncbi:Zn(2)-C6 fungal-type domain-containing protein [Mycena kentingensis (nom. inval.)]|nr:Zn(2)-C6 fungal-type domain-containing protein [Mycena kentingensis (nom. inval.)]